MPRIIRLLLLTSGGVIISFCSTGPAGQTDSGVEEKRKDTGVSRDFEIIPGCIPSEEICDNIDNNCNGTTDEGLTRECSNACGRGSERCYQGNWGDCDAPIQCSCNPGEMDVQSCGNCGSRRRVCSQEGQWMQWEICAGEGECQPYSSETEHCGRDVGECVSGTRIRFCSEQCIWGGWSECRSSVDPKNETCDERDNDCDGQTDEDGICGECAIDTDCPDGRQVCIQTGCYSRASTVIGQECESHYDCQMGYCHEEQDTRRKYCTVHCNPCIEPCPPGSGCQTEGVLMGFFCKLDEMNSECRSELLPLGGECRFHGDCQSNMCAENLHTHRNFCTQQCDPCDEPCPPGSGCHDYVCFPGYSDDQVNCNS